jgi:hypothetical protein
MIASKAARAPATPISSVRNVARYLTASGTAMVAFGCNLKAGRLHDLELVKPSEGAIEGTVQSVMELGFEVQVTVALSDGSTPWVQMSRNEFRTLDVDVSSPVSIRERV